MWGMSWLNEDLLASLEGLCSVQLVSYLALLILRGPVGPFVLTITFKLLHEVS